nr:MAG TPA: hypothetical protein [Caudoviricetes sp.]
MSHFPPQKGGATAKGGRRVSGRTPFHLRFFRNRK